MSKDRQLRNKCKNVIRRDKLEPRNTKKVDELAAVGAMVSIESGIPMVQGCDSECFRFWKWILSAFRDIWKMNHKT